MADLPDWAVGVLETVRDPLYDLAEATVRLGYPGAYERGGNAILIDDFSRGVAAWVVSGTPLEGFRTSSAQYSYFGGNTMLIRAEASAGEIALTRSLPLENVGRWGFEFGFGHITNGDYLEFQLEMYTADFNRYARLYLDIINRKLYIDESGVGLTEILSNTRLDDNVNGRLVFKLIADFENGIYSQLYFNSFRRNLRDYALPSSAAGSEDYIEMTFSFSDVVSTPGLAYLDYMIITTDEADKVVEDS